MISLPVAATAPSAPSVAITVRPMRRASARGRRLRAVGRDLEVAREVGGLVLVDDDDVGGGEILRRKRGVGRQRQDHARACVVRLPRRGERLGQRHLHLEKQRAPWRERRSGAGRRRSRRRSRPAPVTMTFSPFASTVISATPGRPVAARDGGKIDARGGKFRQRDLGEGVGADRADHGDARAGAAGGQRLVGALAAGDQA